MGIKGDKDQKKEQLAIEVCEIPDKRLPADRI